MCNFSKNMEKAKREKKLALSSLYGEMHYNLTQEQRCDPKFHSCDIDALREAFIRSTGSRRAIVISEESERLLHEIISEGHIYNLQDAVEAAILFTYRACTNQESNRYFYNGVLFGKEKLREKGE